MINSIDPNHLLILEDDCDDFRMVLLTKSRFEQLALGDSDMVRLSSQRRCTVGTVAADNELVQDDKVRISCMMHVNLRAKNGELISIQEAKNVKNGIRMTPSPIEDTIAGIKVRDFFDTYVLPYFQNARRPIYRDDLVTIKGNLSTLKFKVTGLEPDPCCYVTDKTFIKCSGIHTKRACALAASNPSILSDNYLTIIMTQRFLNIT